MCMIDGDDDRVTVLHERHRTARKEHRCAECGRGIVVGEPYLVERFINDGEASTHKTCRHCEAVRGWLLSECGGWLYGGVAEDIGEHAQEGAGGLPVKLAAVGISRRWKRSDGRMWPVPRFPADRPKAVRI